MHTSLFGLPGAGKTHYANHTIRHSKYIALMYALYFCASHPVVAVYYVCIIMVQPWISMAFLLRKLRLLLIIFHHSGFALRQEHYVCDEDVVQFLLSLYETKITTKQAHAIVQLLHRYISTIHIVETSENVRLQRIADRKREPRAEFGAEYMHSWNVVMLHNYAVLKEELIRRYPQVVIVHS